MCFELLYAVRSFIHIRKSQLKTAMSTKTTSILKRSRCCPNLSIIHNKYVVVRADENENNIIFVWNNIVYSKIMSFALRTHKAI